MHILSRLPDDVIKYTIDFIPNNHIIHLYSSTSIYYDKKNSSIYIIQISIKSWLKHKKSHLLHIIKFNRSSTNTITYSFDFNRLRKLLIFPKNRFHMLCNSWYINKEYEELVNIICPPPDIKQQLSNAVFQLSSLCTIKYMFGINKSIIPKLFILSYSILFILILILRKIYYLSILK